MEINIHAGEKANPAFLVNVPELVTGYYTGLPDPSVTTERVRFGTSGHRGSSLDKSFNEKHILAISQAVCMYRRYMKIDGPMFFGIDTHALSIPAFETAIEVFAANGVEVLFAADKEYTPTPVISHAISKFNRRRKRELADGIIITPSHNPPHDGGFKYNPPHGGPADKSTTNWIEAKANWYLENNLLNVKRIQFEKAINAPTTRMINFIDEYVSDLGNVVDMDIIRNTNIKLGVDPLGGAGVHYWGPIAERYGLNLTMVDNEVDPTFRFMTVDWDGQIRMDPSSPYAMQRLISLKDQYDIAFACDTDHDRHGIVTQSTGLLPPNHYLSAAILYLFQSRPMWQKESAIGKTVVSSSMIDLIAKKLDRKLYEVPVGFKWFVDGLRDGSLAFGGEESAGASFVQMDGSVWTTDKDGFIPSLLAAEMTAKTGKDPGKIYKELANEFGELYYKRVEVHATLEQRKLLANIAPEQIKHNELTGEKIEKIITRASGNDASIDGLKVSAENGWFAARPSGTENVYKIYAESFIDTEHLNMIIEEAQKIVISAIEKG
jgi:phosphoglucomutase